MKFGAYRSPPAPSSTSRASSSPVVVAALMALAGESFHQGHHNHGADDVRPEFPDDYAAECTDEQPGDPVLVTVRVKHQVCCGSVLPTLNT